ncbi:hypothetical protein [Variovorax sp. E3]|uniref:hypothetical protein n=1 Tax=Variovorax sp. E3 TaxID=1914993 RepID=UPI0018DDC6EE|nr:hypothetical protein [Variovorax sp. E3]
MSKKLRQHDGDEAPADDQTRLSGLRNERLEYSRGKRKHSLEQFVDVAHLTPFVLIFWHLAESLRATRNL